MCFCATSYAKDKNKEQVENKEIEKQTVYIFGVGSAFGDSIIYFTDIQEIQDYKLIEKGFLNYRSIYSYDLKNYLENAMNKPHRVCAVFFSEKKSKIEKKYEKLKNRYQKENGKSFHLLTSEQFSFKAYSKE